MEALKQNLTQTNHVFSVVLETTVQTPRAHITHISDSTFVNISVECESKTLGDDGNLSLDIAGLRMRP